MEAAAILIDDSEEDEVIREEGRGRLSEAIVISDSEEEEIGKDVKVAAKVEPKPSFYIDLSTRDLDEVESTNIRIEGNPKILSQENVAKRKKRESPVQRKLKHNKNTPVPKNINQFLLDEVMRVRDMDQDELDVEVDTDSDNEEDEIVVEKSSWLPGGLDYNLLPQASTSRSLTCSTLMPRKGNKNASCPIEHEIDLDGVRPGKKVSKKQLKAKRRKKEQIREEKERSNPLKKESKKQARRRRQKERKLLQQEIPTIDLVGYEPTTEEILRKRNLEEMKRLEKAEIARITEKRKRDVAEMRMRGGKKAAVAKRLIRGHLGSNRQRREDKYRQELLEDQRRDKRRKKENNLRQLEEEGRAEGLARKLEPDNKGFAMLVRMGYNPGQCLGKDQQGRLEPVTIAMRQGRAGLGSKEP